MEGREGNSLQLFRRKMQRGNECVFTFKEERLYQDSERSFLTERKGHE